MKVAIVGAGRMGHVHAASISRMADVEVAAVADADREAAARLAGELSCAPLEVEAVFASGAIDAVVVCTPNATHVDMIDRAVAAGKPVFCEKPIDLAIDRASACVDAAERAGVPLMVGFNRRFDQNFARARALVEEGGLGEVQVVSIISRDALPPPLSYIPISGGLFRDQMIHDFDLARFILGEEPVAIHAFGSALIDGAIGEAGDVDTAAVTMRTASGKLCQITCSRRSPTGGDRRLEILGSKATLRVENRPTGNVEIASEAGFLRDPVLNSMVDRHGAAFFNAMRHFCDAVAAGAPPSPSGRDGVLALRLADAATESARSGAVVRL